MEMEKVLLLWAKLGDGSVHSLCYHLIDVAQVTLAMWRNVLDAATKQQFAKWFRLGEEQTGRLLAFFAGLHDLGKASPAFQAKLPLLQQRLQESGFTFPSFPSSRLPPHGHISALTLRCLLPTVLNLSPQDAKLIATAVGGHHGSWPAPYHLKPPVLNSAHRGDGAWIEARRMLVHLLWETLELQPVSLKLPDKPGIRNALLCLISGLVCVADWIGSITEYFPYQNHAVPPQEYAQTAGDQARKALQHLGWGKWHTDRRIMTFKQMFPFLPAPNQIQEAVIGLVEKVAPPALLIIEAPTGSGKTEAALYVADIWLQSTSGRGLYVAMPTQATSNQMYDRVRRFLVQRYPGQVLNLQLVHGNALMEERTTASVTQDIRDSDESTAEGTVRAETWFLPRKRSLLAPFGVGTVDQALLSVLQTRHFFVRLYGLSNKVVVFDEVHAYDTYMSELLQRLLRWLGTIGASVLLLSATLPQETRHQLISAYLSKESDLPPSRYPRITIASRDRVCQIPLDSSHRTVHLERVGNEPEEIAELLNRKLCTGGCAAVICNRVQRAQQLYAVIKRANIVPPEDLILFHARFPLVWREEIECSVLRKFSRSSFSADSANPARPVKAIVVATQVIEQSLDLDFDYIISDLAPIDLLIQRAGRLHRHPANDPRRSAALRVPTLTIAVPQDNGGVPNFGHDERVYDRSVLLKTWYMLKDCDKISIPDDTTRLIESVYGGALTVVDEQWRNAIERAEEQAAKARQNAVFQARGCMIGEPEDEDLPWAMTGELEEEDPTVHTALRALTRLAEPSVSLVCLHAVHGSVFLDPECEGQAVDLTSSPDAALTRELLRRTITVQRHEVVEHFHKCIPYAPWRENAALRYHYPVVFEQGRCKPKDASFTLVLTREMGLEIVIE